MKPKRIILVRHGQSEGNADKLVYTSIPDHRVKLTTKGHQQAIEAGAEIANIIGNETVQVYLSPLIRTRQTFEGISKRLQPNIVDVLEDPRIREKEYGHLRSDEDLKKILAERRAYGKFYYRLPDGESPADVYDRLSTFMESMYRAFEQPDFPENALIVSHGAAIRIFIMRWYRLKVEEYLNLRNPKNCQLIVMEQNSQGKYDLVRGLETKDGSNI